MTWEGFGLSMRQTRLLFMAKKILFPFSAATSSYYEGYSWASELASKMGTELLLFTSSPSKDEQSLQHIYHSLLGAQGYYLQSAYHTDSRPARTERWIETGDLKNTLLDFLKTNTSYITIIDPSLPLFDQPLLSEVIQFSGGVIVLPSSPGQAEENNQGAFYEKLHKAEVYKLPQNFFDALGSDRSLFNYLSRFFRKKK